MKHAIRFMLMLSVAALWVSALLFGWMIYDLLRSDAPLAKVLTTSLHAVASAANAYIGACLIRDSKKRGTGNEDPQT